MARGRLRIYLGAAPGVGKTVAMLAEGRRRRDRGTDVVIGFLETHGRSFTAGQADGLEVVPRRAVEHRGASLTELDVDAVLARRPEVALVDELAHTNAPGSPRTKRWEDIDVLLDAGIDVISTVNIQHLESLNDVVEAITGVVQRETVPDDVVRSADQIELVDMSPESLRRRMSHGNIYPAARIDAALANYFRPGNLSALRELALLWLADRVDETLERYRASHGISAPWPTRERIVVALTGGPEGETVLRRAAQIASRGAGSELLACHVSRPDGLVDADPETLAAQRKLVKELGGVMHEVAGQRRRRVDPRRRPRRQRHPDRHRHQPPLRGWPGSLDAASASRWPRHPATSTCTWSATPAAASRVCGSATTASEPRDAGAAGCSPPWASPWSPSACSPPRTARAAARGAAVPLAHRRDRARRRPAAGHRLCRASRRWSSTGSSPTRRAP